jgi:phenylacetate-CoA ligase
MDEYLARGLQVSLMDVARGAYFRSPAVVRRSIAPMVSLIPTRLKFGNTYRYWRAQIARASSDSQFAAERHVSGLRAIMQRAHARSPFYRELFDRSFGRGYDLSSLEPADLQRLPVLRKEDFREAGDTMLTVPKSQADFGDTSGSNGEQPFSFYLDKDRSAREMAFVYDNWSRVGFAEGMAKVVLRGFELDPGGWFNNEWEPALKELRLPVFPMTVESVSHYVDLIDRLEIRYLYGYPSAFELMARTMCKLGRNLKLPLKGILPMSEPLYPHQRRIIAHVFGPAPIAHFYGMSEKVLFAREIDDNGTYEFDSLYGLAELVDDNGKQITEPGREGRLVGTGLLSAAMPFIRYDTEDRATLVSPAISEGGYRLRVERLIPRRKPDFLIAEDGTRVVTIDFTPDSPRFFTGVEEYQFYQHRVGHCTMRYVATPDGIEADAQRIVDGLQKRAQGRIVFDIEKVTQLAGGRAGKRAFIDQRLDISRY